MKTLRVIVTFLLLAGAVVPAVAQPYLGFGAGVADYDRGNAVPDLITSGNFDGDASGFKIYGGYRFHPNFAAELSYIDLGNAKYSGTFGGAPVTGGSLETIGFNVSAMAIVPLGPVFELFGKIGIFGWESKARDTTSGVPFSGKADDSDVSFGLGANFNLSRNLTLRAEWERLKAVGDIDLYTAGLLFRFY